MRKLLALLGVLFFFVPTGKTQDCCDSDDRLVICYTAMDDYCTPPICGFTLDGEHMQGLLKKISNPSNFGLSGIATCEVDIVKLVNITTVSDVEALFCDIVFLGTFYDFPNVSETVLPETLLTSVRDWSMICQENLTILSQAETRAWGYEIANQNENPNTPGMINTPNIFNGAFGSLNEFDQGGAFTANFQTVPATGAITLAEDAQQRATIVLDNETNDILLADVGILCSGVAGEVSDTPDVENNNDILACNIFALGCEIAGVGSFTNVDTTICVNGTLTLPDGIEVDQPGTYTSTLLSSTLCDSIIVTELAISDPLEGIEFYEGCDQDGYMVQVGNDIYDQSNPSGISTVINGFGCDSLVEVELIFNMNTEAVFDTTICKGEPFDYLGVSYSTLTDTIVTISNANNCDSTINIIVDLFEFQDITIEEEILLLNTGSYTIENNIPSIYTASWLPAEGLSCSDCHNPTISAEANITQYALILTSTDGCEINYTVNVEYVCTPYIPNIFAPNSLSNNHLFTAETPCTLADYSMVVYDRWGSIVFKSDDQTIKWDGKIDQRKDIVPGVYVYICTYSNNGELVNKTGTITCVR